jgi:phosphoserine phosphatase RsbU/P
MNADDLRKFPLFANLPDNDLHSLSETLLACTYQPGEILLKESSLSEYFYLVLEGEIEVLKSMGTADERLLGVSKKGTVLGEMSMFSKHGTHTASARARTPARLMQISFDQFDTILHRHPGMAYDLLRLYSSRLEDSENLTIRDLRQKNAQLTQAYFELQAAQSAMIEKEKLEHELQIAAEIQRGILPQEQLNYRGYDFGALMVPARQVGGDFYDFIPLDEDHLGIVIGDVCDKGMPAALFMALAYSFTRTEAYRHTSPGSMLRQVNQHLHKINRSMMYVTLIYGVLDCRNGQFQYARAGHPEPLVLDHQRRVVSTHKGLGQPLGLFANPALDEQSIQIPSEGSLLIYSDGLSDTIENSPSGGTLIDLCTSLLQPDTISAQAFCKRLWHSLGGDSTASLIQDDFTLVAVRRQQQS